MAMSTLEARILWSVIDDELTRIECPPETRIERKGNSGVVDDDVLVVTVLF